MIPISVVNHTLAFFTAACLAAVAGATDPVFKCGALPMEGHGLAKSAAQADFVSGTRKVLVIRVGFPDAPFTNDSAAMAAVNDSVAQLYNGMSRAKFGWAFRMHPGVITAPKLKASYFGQGRQVNDSLIAFVNAKLTELGLKAGVDYQHFVVNHPRDTTLPYEGSSGYPNPDQWMNGTYRALVLGHEIGHGLGLPHAAGVEADAAIMPAHSGPPTQTESVEYGDRYDIMGDGGIKGHFNSIFKENFGWIDSSEIRVVNQSGTFRIFAHDQPGNAGKLMAIRLPTAGGFMSYYVEHRSQVTQAESTAPRGAEVRIWGYLPGPPAPQWSRTGILDMHPKSIAGTARGGNADFHDAALLTDETYPDRFGTFTLKTVAVGSHSTPADSWVDVQVAWGAVGIRISRGVSRNGGVASVVPVEALKAGVKASDLLGRSWLGVPTSQAPAALPPYGWRWSAREHR